MPIQDGFHLLKEPNERISVHLHRTLDAAWFTLPSVRLGARTSGVGIPRCFVGVSEAGSPSWYLEAHSAPNHHCFREEAAVVADTLFVGLGQQIHTVHLSTRTVVVKRPS